MKILWVILAALTLSACASQHQLAMPSGEYRQLNVGRWEFNANALTTPPPGQLARAN